MLLTTGPDDVDPREDHDPFSACYAVIWQRDPPEPAPPEPPESRRRTFTKPGPRWQLRRWLDTDLTEWMP